MAGIFITGTDNKVGKTYITCALLKGLCAAGVPALGFKPIACGNREDARAMREASHSSQSLEAINPIYLRAHAEPQIAAQLERQEIDIEKIKKAYQDLVDSGYTVIVEGTGGWNTPVCPGLSMADIAVTLQLPVLLVANNRLGAANLVSLTASAIKSKGLTCCGIVLNHIGDEWDTASVTNRQLIEELTALPVVAEIIHGQEELDSSAIPGL